MYTVELVYLLYGILKNMLSSEFLISGTAV